MNMDELTQPARLLCVAFYTEPGRFYHTLKHTEAMLDALDRRGVLTYPLALAVWGHDLIYDPARGDNEARSASGWQRRALPTNSSTTLRR